MIKHIAFAVAVFFSSISPTLAYTLSSPSGGDCAAIGTWNPDTLTCTLTTNIVNDPITIASDGITLDGAGHTLTGNGNMFSIGMDIRNASDSTRRLFGVTIKNLTFDNWGTGMNLNAATSTLAERNIIKNSTVGIVGSYGSYVSDLVRYSQTIRNNIFENIGSTGILLSGLPVDITVENNTIRMKEGSAHGINLTDSYGIPSTKIIRNNTVTYEGTTPEDGRTNTGISYFRTANIYVGSSYCLPADSHLELTHLLSGNIVENFGIGIDFHTNCSDSHTDFSHNVMKGNALGLRIADPSGYVQTTANDFLNNLHSAKAHPSAYNY